MKKLSEMKMIAAAALAAQKVKEDAERRGRITRLLEESIQQALVEECVESAIIYGSKADAEVATELLRCAGYKISSVVGEECICVTVDLR